ncbi:MAG: serine/threonine-protein phosphatase [Spirochaetia bacterium]|nr:serine/threonine-protein phosphatase [Spirochaetia bacterium]
MVDTQEESVFKTKDFKTFLNGLIHQWLKTLTIIGITLVPLFGILDYFIMPTELVTRFWTYRFIYSTILLVQYFIIRLSKPGKYSFVHVYFASALTSLTIVQMTVDLGGFNASYYQGLNLVIIAVNLLIPWKPVHSAINGMITTGMYLIMNYFYGMEYNIQILISNLFFMISTVIIAVSINYLRHNLIKKEFELRAELKDARDALWGEMEIAKRIQTALLPEQIRLKNYEAYATMLPADEVGGDYYDIIETSHGETWMAIGDVSGHGVESGLIMMMTHTCIYSLINQRRDLMPSKILENVNYVIKENIRRLDVSRYVTLTVLKLENNHFIHSGKHQDIIIFRAVKNLVETVPSKGTWIGITDDLRNYLHDEKVEMLPGDVLLLYTDGLTEAENDQNEMYGLERLVKVFEKNAREPIKNIIENIMKDVASYQKVQNDDITVLACRKL